MRTRSAFHLDCNPIIPDCGYQCAKCLQELRAVFEGLDGVWRFYTEGELGEDLAIVIEHDAGAVSVEELMAAFRRLPSFYKGSFLPRLLQA